MTEPLTPEEKAGILSLEKAIAEAAARVWERHPNNPANKG